MTTRTHTRSKVDPADWAIVGYFYTGSAVELISEYMYDHQDLDHKLGSGWFARVESQCQSCGARYLHGTAVRHTSTQEVLFVGHTCGSDLFGLPSIVAKRQRQAAKAKARNANVVAGIQFLVDDPELSSIFAKVWDGIPVVTD